MQTCSCYIVWTSNKHKLVEDTVEYFFALTPDPAPPTYATWTNATITHFVSECPEVAACHTDKDSSSYGARLGSQWGLWASSALRRELEPQASKPDGLYMARS